MSKSKTRPPLEKEIYSIIIGIVITSLIFSHNYTNPWNTFSNLPKTFAIIFISMTIYLIAQHGMAKKLHTVVIYELWLPGVILSLMLMLVGIKLALVGGIAITAYKFGRWGMKDKGPTIQEIGFISTIGPITNIILSMATGLLAAKYGYQFMDYFSTINGWLAFYNLVPVKNLDGGKVLFWSPVAWFILIFITLLLITPSNILTAI